MLFRLPILLCLFLFTTSCGAEKATEDRAPLGKFDLSTISEPIPHPLTITKAGNRSPYKVNGVCYEVVARDLDFREIGTASWYGMKFHGKPTSNGEIFDVFKLTAAHKSLPIPCFARITNLENNRSVIVRINDRGPFVEGRILDLSWAAAAKLGFVEQGLAEVELELITCTSNAEI